jgi:multicomponent Na+:H+ antiporter subunit E
MSVVRFAGRILFACWYLINFFIAIVKANIQVARIALTPGRPRYRSAFIKYRTKAAGDIQITCLANSITLTPGTITVDVSPDKKYLFVHVLSCDDPDEVKKGIETELERPLLRIFK